MSIKKIKLPDGTIKWEAYSRVLSQGDKRLRRRFDKKIEAQTFLDSLKQRKNEVFNIVSNKEISDITARNFNEEADYWLKTKGQEFTLGYMRVINPALKKARKFYGHHTIEKFSPALLADFRLKLKSEGVSSSTQNRYADIIRRIITFSFEQKRINQNPCLGYKSLVEISEGIEIWTEKEIQVFLAFADKKYPAKTKDRWKFIVYLLELETGLRAREIWGLKVKDFLIEGTKFKVSRQLSTDGTFTPTKGKDFRNAPYSQNLRTEIEEWIKFSNITDTDRTLFVTTANTPIDHDNFSDRVFQKDMKEAGVTLIRFHDLRHTALSHMVRRGVRIEIVQKIAGHKDLKTTMRYIHILGEDISDVGASLSLAPEKAFKKPDLKIV